MLLLSLLSCLEIKVDGCQDMVVGATITVTAPPASSDDIDDYTCTWKTYGHSDSAELEPDEEGGRSVVVSALEAGSFTLEATCTRGGSRDKAQCPIHVSDELVDLSGDWEAEYEVLEATGACAGEEGETRSDSLSLVHDPSVGSVYVSGSSGLSTEGSYSGGELNFAGDFSESGGTTYSEVTAQWVAGSLVGHEKWTWTRGGEDEPVCSGSSSFQAQRE